MKLLKWAYEKRTGRKAPYYYSFSILTIIGKPIRKFVAQVLAPNCPFNNLRVLLYRICGFKIGRNVFIGMKCYLDDTCYSKMLIGNNVTIYANATILGDITIGDNTTIGSSTWIKTSIPANSRVMIPDPEIIITERIKKQPS